MKFAGSVRRLGVTDWPSALGNRRPWGTHESGADCQKSYAGDSHNPSAGRDLNGAIPLLSSVMRAILGISKCGQVPAASDPRAFHPVDGSHSNCKFRPVLRPPLRPGSTAATVLLPDQRPLRHKLLRRHPQPCAARN